MFGQLCPGALVAGAELDDEVEIVVVVCACTGRAARGPMMAKRDGAATSRTPFLLVTMLVFNSDSPPAIRGVGSIWKISEMAP
jgi:hypothetical protein